MIKGSYGRNQQESFPSISHQNLDMFNGMDFQCLVGGGVWFLLFFFFIISILKIFQSLE